MISALLLFDRMLLPGVNEEYVDFPLFNFGNSLEDQFIAGFVTRILSDVICFSAVSGLLFVVISRVSSTLPSNINSRVGEDDTSSVFTVVGGKRKVHSS